MSFARFHALRNKLECRFNFNFSESLILDGLLLKLWELSENLSKRFLYEYAESKVFNFSMYMKNVESKYALVRDARARDTLKYLFFVRNGAIFMNARKILETCNSSGRCFSSRWAEERSLKRKS